MVGLVMLPLGWMSWGVSVCLVSYVQSIVEPMLAQGCERGVECKKVNKMPPSQIFI